MTGTTTVTDLTCPRCGLVHPANELHALCTCGSPLFVRYDLDRIARTFDRDAIHARDGMWAWRPVLPLPFDEQPVTLGEGGTPLLDAESLGRRFGCDRGRLYIKEESLNPTASFKARGLSAAVTMARHFGRKKLVIPTAGNAGGALAAYAARAGLEARVLVPKDAPAAHIREMRLLGATVELVDGLITDCGARARRLAESEGYHDVSTLKEPYRLEGKKTLGYELACALHWRLPDVIVYPTGGGTGLIGMWKAFAEMRAMGWLDQSAPLPRMVAVQAEGCAPIVHAFEHGLEAAARWEDARTIAAGLRVPAAVGDRLILAAVRDSAGVAIAVPDDEITDCTNTVAREGGLLIAPEVGACFAGLRRLRKSGFLSGREEVVVFATGSGLKYLDVLAP